MMRWTGVLFGSAGVLGLLGCADSLTEPPGSLPPPPEVERPSVPATAMLAFVSTRDGSPHVYVANADGSRATRVAEGSSPAWSWDARRIAFVREASGAGPAGIYVINVDGSGLRYVGPGDSPAWSPDGRQWSSFEPDRIAFRGVSGTVSSNGWLLPVYSLYVMRTNGAGRIALDDRNPFVGAAAWSPDGHRIAFQRGAGVWIVDADGSDLRRLDSIPELGSPPAWAPDGSRIAVVTNPGPWRICDGWPPCRSGSGKGKSSVIYVSDPAGADRETIPAIYPAPAIVANPDWSPDGSQLVFDLLDASATCVGFYCGPESPQRRVFALVLETGEVRRLVPEAEHPAVADYEDYHPVWSRTPR